MSASDASASENWSDVDVLFGKNGKYPIIAENIQRTHSNILRSSIVPFSRAGPIFSIVEIGELFSGALFRSWK